MREPPQRAWEACPSRAHSPPQAAVITVTSSVCGSPLFKVPDTTADGLAPSGTWEGSRGSSHLLELGVAALSLLAPPHPTLHTPIFIAQGPPQSLYKALANFLHCSPQQLSPNATSLLGPCTTQRPLTSLQTMALCLRENAVGSGSVSRQPGSGHVRLHPQQPPWRPGAGASSSKASLSSPVLLPLRTHATISLPSGPFLQPINTLVPRFL